MKSAIHRSRFSFENRVGQIRTITQPTLQNGMNSLALRRIEIRGPLKPPLLRIRTKPRRPKPSGPNPCGTMMLRR